MDITLTPWEIRRNACLRTTVKLDGAQATIRSNHWRHCASIVDVFGFGYDAPWAIVMHKLESGDREFSTAAKFTDYGLGCR